MEVVIAIYIVAVNIAAFAMMGIDKRRAILGLWRIPEATLLGCAAIGGSVGALLGMRVFRHKTRKPKFSFGVPAILVCQLALLYAALR